MLEKINKLKLDKRLCYQQYLEGKIDGIKYFKQKDKIEKTIDLTKNSLNNLNNIHNKKNDEDIFSYYFIDKQMIDKFIKCIYVYSKDKIEIKWKL